MGFGLWAKNRRLLLASFGALLVIAVGEVFLSLGHYIAVVSMVIVLWALISINKDEVLQLKDYISEKLFRNLPSSDMSSP